jgi:uncharacterized protein with FMN-binding domain
MRSLTDSKTTVAVLAGLTLVGALAGCSPTTTTETPTDDSTTESTDETTETETETETDATTATYTDGTYEATGEYQSPNGTESLDVTITLENDVITAVEVVGAGGSPNTERFQGEFADGIAAIVVGKDIDEISVSKVAGSSLASGGFNAAVEQIKADAAS